MFTQRIRFLLLTATILLLVSLVSGAYAASYNFSTADNKLDGLSNNSGWWSGGSSVADTTTNDIFLQGHTMV